MARKATATTTTGARIGMNGADASVVFIGAATAVYPWWEPLVAAVPDIAQGIILLGTVVYVVARATNEVTKLWREDRRDKK